MKHEPHEPLTRAEWEEMAQIRPDYPEANTGRFFDVASAVFAFALSALVAALLAVAILR